VAVGIVDVAAVGARVLLTLQPPAGWAVREVALTLEGVSSSTGGQGESSEPRPVLARGGEARPCSSGDGGAEAAVAEPALLVRNFYESAAAADSEARPQVSLLVLNAVLPEEAQAEAAAAVLGLLERPAGGEGEGSGAGGAASRQQAQQGAVEGAGGGPLGGAQVYVAAALLMQHVAQPEGLYQHLLNGAQPPPSGPPLPALPAGPAARVRDGQLAALLHVLAVSGTPACCLLAPGHKPPSSTTLDLPGSAAACDALGGALAALLGLQYEPGACRAVRALHKWFVPENTAGSDVMYM
ncbi:hypothetical protein TSOC_002054, partial [Tetrabaena socialis]